METIFRCSKCQVELSEDNCYQSKDKKYINRKGFLHTCKLCGKDRVKAWMNTDRGKKMHRLSEARRRAKNKEKYLWETAKRRAKLKGIDFNIEISDITIPTHCPVLGMKLIGSDGVNLDKKSSPSIDRIDSSKGYVKGNIVVISNRANILKGNATKEEIEKIFIWYSSI